MAVTATGLQQFMIQTYTWMMLGLALTGVVAVFTVTNEAVMAAIFANRMIFFGLIIAEFALVFAFTMALRKGAAPATLLTMFLVYAALNGLTLSVILLVYTYESVAQAFFVSAGMFGGMSLYGYVTKRDLTGLGSFAAMGVWGLIIAVVINFFLNSSVLNLAISAIGVVIFTILSAYDTQKLKAYYAHYAADGEGLKRVSLGGALTLYLDFINLFLFLLRFLGNRR
ncbi:MAG: Bax inhibitor-1/YccA family protein [Deltaproteobacteria bacterium]|nr:Bax inhibitor-1/YccA family protein [Deltaproteobacteria bacterium]